MLRSEPELSAEADSAIKGVGEMVNAAVGLFKLVCDPIMLSLGSELIQRAKLGS